MHVRLCIEEKCCHPDEFQNTALQTLGAKTSSRHGGSRLKDCRSSGFTLHTTSSVREPILETCHTMTCRNLLPSQNSSILCTPSCGDQNRHSLAPFSSELGCSLHCYKSNVEILLTSYREAHNDRWFKSILSNTSFENQRHEQTQKIAFWLIK